MLWLAIYLPTLPLEVFTRGTEQQTPCIISDGQHRRARVMLANEQAMQFGISVGMSVSTACVLSTSVQVFNRQSNQEQQALAQLAAWAGQFSSMVSLISAPGLVLELAASVKLFGGLEALFSRIQIGLSGLGYQAFYAIAPTPLAAEWMSLNSIDSKNQKIEIVLDKARLPDVMARLPLDIIGFSENELRDLTAMGLRTLGDALRLPRKAFTQRIGQKWRQQFDQALGSRPDPRQAWVMPLSYHGHIMLPAIAASSQSLLFAGQRLLHELVGQLHATQTGVQTLEWQLRHEDQTQTSFMQSMLSPGRDLSRLRLLFQASLERLVLPAEVCEVALHVSTLISMTATSQDLFSSESSVTDTHEAFVERLYARLGEKSVLGVDQVMDHRPEYAWRLIRSGGEGKKIGKKRPGKQIEFCSQKQLADRPLWLLRVPQPLKTRDKHPYLGGSLMLSSDYECIESGWWDEHDVRRDYFVARNQAGECFWVFRNRDQSFDWYVHGYFC